MPRPQIRLPNAQADRPRPVVLWAIGISFFAVGLALATASLSAPGPATAEAGTETESGTETETETETESESESETDSETESESESESETETDSETDSESESESQTETDSDSETESESESESETESETETETETETESESETETDSETETAIPFLPRRVTPGRLAYLRCDGIPAQTGPFPCPRDRELERAAYAALESLTECAAAPAALGEGDLRLTFAGDAPVDISVRGRGDTPVPEGPISSCLRTALGAATTEIRADELVVSLHFTLTRR